MLHTAETSLREHLALQNYYICVPEGLETHPEICDRVTRSDLRFADLSIAELVVADALLQERDGWSPILPNGQLNEMSETSEEEVLIEISRRKKFIAAALGQTGFSTSNDEKEELHFNNQNVAKIEFSAAHLTLGNILKKSKTAQDQLKIWLRNLARNTGGIITIGHDNTVATTGEFILIEPRLGDTGDAINPSRMLQLEATHALRKIVSDARSIRRITAEQQELAVDRDIFTWENNPLISQVRAQAGELIKEYQANVSKHGVTEFDLSAQLMMHLPTYPPELVWTGDEDTIQQICKLINQENGSAANALLEEAVSSGRVQLNMDLVRIECARHAAKLADLYGALEVSVDGKNVKLPSQYMGDPELNPFKDVPRTEIDARDRKMIDETTMAVKEKHSGRTILLRPIPLEVSKLYSLGFSNLHYARDGEIAAYGAFLEGDELPFAYSAYSHVTRAYAKDMLHYYGIDPTTVLDSTRAWNAPWAPENTMSTLFAYAHTMLKSQVADNKTLNGVMTSINPNLGFRAVSFRGVRFNVAGMKPTDFSYCSNGDGTADFMPKGIMKERLGISDDKILENDPRFVRCNIPLLPTIELLSLFDTQDEARLLEKPIYRITREAMIKG